MKSDLLQFFDLPMWLALLALILTTLVRLRRLERDAHAPVDLRPAIADEVTRQLAKHPITTHDHKVLIEMIRADSEVAKEMVKSMGERAKRSERFG